MPTVMLVVRLRGRGTSSGLGLVPTRPLAGLSDSSPSRASRRGDLVLDIGAGDGALTAPLLELGARVVAIELHPGRAAALRRRFGDDVRVVQVDAADLRLPRRPFRVVANPPWAITDATPAAPAPPASRLVRADLLLKRSATRRWVDARRPRTATTSAPAPRSLAEPSVPAPDRWPSPRDRADSRSPPATRQDAIVSADDSSDEWDALGERFVDHHYASLRGRVRTHVIDEHLRAHLAPPPLHVVDVGGGAGHQSLPLARAGYEVTIVDPSPSMLERAAQLLAQRRRPGGRPGAARRGERRGCAGRSRGSRVRRRPLPWRADVPRRSDATGGRAVRARRPRRGSCRSWPRTSR